jgi:hypothetical protein
MVSLSKVLCAVLASCALMGCATNTGNGGASGEAGKTASAQRPGGKVAASSCMSRMQAELEQCEAKCPKATGNEHFTIQHKLAMEYAACKEECATQIEKQAGGCKASG